MVNYKGSCVICGNTISNKYNYCRKCLFEERKKGNNPSVLYNACEGCGGEDCQCCEVKT